MQRATDVHDRGIDLHRVDRGDVVLDGRGDIGPGSGADDERALEPSIGKPAIDLRVEMLPLCFGRHV